MNYLLKKFFVLMVCLVTSCIVFSQADNTFLLRDAKNSELKFDEAGALSKYKMIVKNDSNNINALVKCAEFYCSIGKRQKDKKIKLIYFDSAETYARQAFTSDVRSADANYAMSLVAFQKADMENDNKKLIDYIKQIKTFVDASLAVNINNAKANYLLGKWHYELMHSGWLKKKPVKDFCACIPDTQLDSAAYYMEKSITIDPYYALDYLELAKVYQYDNQPAKALDVLNKLVRLPNRTFDDAAIKDEGKQMLAAMK